ncbi:hypothetical protein SEA_ALUMINUMJESUS_88 [Microbacterium phage AluminumJesus]|nr:hypothetical protein SEA_ALUMINUMJESUS_88 [Microbacterium phage AluminumJesus]UVG34459.1 hypothetical protein SEA_GAZEBO_90 [Microbacterium phage Gazebo]
MPYITKTIAKDLPNGDYIEVTAQERDDSGTLSPGFSVTCSLWEHRSSHRGRIRKRNGLEADAFGAWDEEILHTFPELKPIIDVHLADQAGVPIHAKANGFYFYSGKAAEHERARAKGELASYYGKMLEVSDHDRGARALRISPEELPTGLDRAGFEAFVDSLTERYAADAARAREVMAAMVDGQGVER